MARRSSAVSLAVVGLAAMIAVGGEPVTAQDASPVASPSAAACTLEPRSVEALVGFYFDPAGTPVATPTPAASPVATETALPQGEPADPQTQAAVDAVVAEIFACFDANQYARGFALMTDDLARQFGPDLTDPTEDTAEEVRALLEAQLAGTPVADEEVMPEGERTELSLGRDVRILPDGRVGGIWEVGGDAVFLILEQQGDRWLADEIIEILETEPAEAATPAG